MDKIIYYSIDLKSDLKTTFDMFTNNKMLETWLTSVADVEQTVGGKYELFWDPNNLEDNSTIGCRITGIKPYHFISFEWRSPKQFKHFANKADPLTHVVVFFIPTKQGTEVNLVHSGWRKSSEWEEARIWQEKAWAVAFKALEKCLNENI